MQDEFFIGWQDKAPPSYVRLMRISVAVLFLLVLAVAALLPMAQRPFDNAVFEFGEITEIEGVLVKQPALMLRVDFGADAAGAPVFRHLLLSGFGKHGADAAIADWEKQLGHSLDGQRVRLSAQLLYFDGQTILELVESQLPEVLAHSERQLIPKPEVLGNVTLRGEILDPKCAFGAMKPGYGKPHRSCAVRCISGGVPAVFRTTSANGATEYFLITGPTGEAANTAILPYVADQVQLRGKVVQWGDWSLLMLDETPSLVRLAPWWMEDAGRLCSRVQ